MNRGLYTAATGMQMGQQWLDVVANNLANVSTNGFKRDEVTFEESFSRQVRLNAGYGPVAGELQSGPKASHTVTLQQRGATQMTNNPMDLAINSEVGMFAVQTPSGVAYTRDGSFDMNSEGLLVTKSGFPVLATDGTPIELPKGPVAFSAEGTIKDASGIVRQVAVMEGNFKKLGDNLYRAEGRPTAMTSPRIVTGAVEGSNVNVVETMVEMIQVQRIYEMAQRSVQQHDEASQQLIQRLLGS